MTSDLKYSPSKIAVSRKNVIIFISLLLFKSILVEETQTGF